jgi:Ca2+-binding EF-hand superfamily protein
MGNASSTSKGTGLAAVAEMMHLTKPQLMDIRKSCAAMASKDGQIRRKLFHIAVAKAGVQGHLDTDILDLLFTMWDENCDNRVLYLDFMVGIAPLACRYENMNSALKFILQVLDHKKSGKIDSSELLSILKSKFMHSCIFCGSLCCVQHTTFCYHVSIVHRQDSRAHIILSTLYFLYSHIAGVNMTASFFGDSVLTENQMYKITDSVFDTITMISSDSETIDQSGTYDHEQFSHCRLFSSLCLPIYLPILFTTHSHTHTLNHIQRSLLGSFRMCPNVASRTID